MNHFHQMKKKEEKTTIKENQYSIIQISMVIFTKMKSIHLQKWIQY